MVARDIDSILMSLTGKYSSLKEFAQRLEDRLRFEGFCNLEVGIDRKNRAVTILVSEGQRYFPVVTIFLNYEKKDEFPYHFKHEEFFTSDEKSILVWNKENLAKVRRER